MSELKRYEEMLKRNKATIKELSDQNKHIEAHIKFLKATQATDIRELDELLVSNDMGRDDFPQGEE